MRALLVRNFTKISRYHVSLEAVVSDDPILLFVVWYFHSLVNDFVFANLCQKRPAPSMIHERYDGRYTS